MFLKSFKLDKNVFNRTVQCFVLTHCKKKKSPETILLLQAFEGYLKQVGVENSRQLLTNCIYLEDSGIDLCGITVYGSPW